LRARHPDFHLDIDTQPHQLARLGDGLDAAVVLARDVDPSFHSRRLGRNRVVAIGARGLANGPEAIRTPEDIADRTILIHRDMPELFNGWRRSLGLPRLEPAAIDQFDSGQLMLDAAHQGIGVAFMLEGHLKDSHDETLVALFPPIETSYSYWFACRRTALSRRAVKVFHDWLIGAFSED
jgi:LysR family glycine cleavage system transcriptional activator